MSGKKAITMLMAEDDDEDFFLAEEALQEAKVLNKLYRVRNGEELLAYLRREGTYSDEDLFPFPHLILLDLNMPKMDGKEALREIKNDPSLRTVPIVIMTTSKEEADVVEAYSLGTNSYIRKPVNFDELTKAMGDLGRYWFEIVELPPAED